MTKPLEHVAYHEAGHAVVAIAFRHRVLRAVVTPDGPAGVVESELPEWITNGVESGSFVGRNLAPGERRSFENHLTIDCAGAAAEAKFSGADVGVVKGQDIRNTGLFLLLLRSDDDGPLRKAALTAAVRRAEAILDRRWHEVQAVAAALLERGELTGAEVKAAMAAANRKGK